MNNGKTGVLFVTHSDKKGGAEQSLIHLINYLDSSKYRIYLLCPGNASYLHEIRAEYEHFPLRLNSIRKRAGFGYLETILRLKAFVKKNRIEIVHANGWRAPWYTAPLKFLAGSKLVWHHRDFFRQRMFNRVLPKFFDRVICISHFVANSIQGPNKTIVYNGIDPELAPTPKSRTFMEDDTLVIGMFGRIVEWKRYHLVVEAVKKLADDKAYNWKLLIVGDTSVDGSDSYYDDLIRKVRSYGLEENVVFYGYSPKPLDVMKECDLTVNFSLNEPFGRVIIESMLAHTPVIVSDSGGAPEIVRRTQGGLIVKDGDVVALYEAIRLVYDKSVDYENLSGQGYAGVMNEFHMKTVAGKVEQVYQSLLAGNLRPEAAV